MEELDHFLIVGLGNPGALYRHTRHNVGFEMVQAFAQKQCAQWRETPSFSGKSCQVIIDGKKGCLLLPTTFMNRSGEAVRKWIDYYKTRLDRLLIVCDDIALPLNSLKLRNQGSCGGHNGLKSIEMHLNTKYYARLRIGIGRPREEGLADYVLGHFAQEEKALIEKMTSEVLEVLEIWIKAGIVSAMQRANRPLSTD